MNEPDAAPAAAVAAAARRADGYTPPAPAAPAAPAGLAAMPAAPAADEPADEPPVERHVLTELRSGGSARSRPTAYRSRFCEIR